MECYLVNDDSVVEVKRDEWVAQTFTPVADHRGWYLQYKVYATPATTRVLIELQETTGGEPNGSVLASSSVRLDRLSQYSPGKIFNDTFFFGCDLKAGVLYALVMRPQTMRWVDKVYWRYDAGDATYPRGHRLHSTDAGSSWTHFANDCLMFCVWGDPPSPPPPPAPPKDNWALLDVIQTDTGTGIKFEVATNVPCHLFMLWTDQEPEKHLTPIIRRGVLWKDAIRFCFVNWHENEQEEEGYTLYHTFTKEPWAVCETRWFTFRAKIEDEWSPSVGPIFTKHRVAAPVTITLYPDPDPEVTCCDGFATAEGGYYGKDWAVIHDGVAWSGHAGGTGINIYLRSGDRSNKWRSITRLFLLFDASIIPPGATILEAKLRVHGAGKTRTMVAPLFGMVVVPSSPASNTNITKDDYQSIGTTLLSNTHILYDDYDDAGWNEFPLNAAGLAAITPGQIVKLGVRDGGYDVPDAPPVWASSKQIIMAFQSADWLDSLSPELVVTYMPL